MTIASNPITKTPRWLIGGVLFLTLGLMPISATHAQDTGAVGRRLRAAVEAGEITPEQARTMMQALTRETHDEQAERRISREDYARAETELKQAVENGRISAEDAQTRLREMRQMIAAPDEQTRATRTEVDWEAIQQRIELAVKEGQMTRAEANAAHQGIRERMAAAEKNRQAQRRNRAEYARAEAEMMKLFEAGTITREQMAQRLNRMRQAMAKDGARAEQAAPSITREDYARAAAEMQKMVDAGKITEVQMSHRLNRMREMIAGSERTEHATQRTTREDYARAEAEMKKMIEAGKITEEQMRQRLTGMRQAIAEQADRNETKREIDWDAIQKRVETAVKEGKMTRAEADELYRGIKQRLAAPERKKDK